jgi:peroxin-10
MSGSLPPPAPVFPGAPTTDVVRSVQRDVFALDELRSHISRASEVVLGTRYAAMYSGKLKILSDMLYYAVSSVAGVQTVGEEYGEILPMHAQSGGPMFPRLLHRALSVLMHTCGPAALTLLFGRVASSGGPASLTSLVVPRAGVAMRISRWNQVHLGLFYLQGRFYHFSQRLLGISYVSTSEPSPTPSPFKILGVLILIQAVTRAAISTRGWFKRRAALREEVGGDDDHTAASDDDDDDHGGTDSTPSCVLCLNPCKAATSTPCGHLFCWRCICDWCNKKAQCPVCRQPASHQTLWIVNLK